MLVTEVFVPIAEAVLASFDVKDHPMVVLPEETDFQTGDALRHAAQRAVAEIFGISTAS